jgi:ferredoxin
MTTLIIGSGLSALAVVKALSDSTDEKIYLIDANLRHQIQDKGPIGVSAKKTLFGSSHMYEETEFTLPAVSSLSLSYAAGGLSTVWGAGIRLWDKSSVLEITENTDNFYKSAKLLLDVVPYFGNNETMNIPLDTPITSIDAPYDENSFFDVIDGNPNLNTKIFQTPLAVRTTGFNSCVGCGLCLTGCPYGSIFSSIEYIDDCVKKEKVVRIQGKVFSLKQLIAGVEVSYKNELNQSDIVVVDQVYMCAGAIGTPAILMQSNLLGSKIEIKDSQVFYFVGLYRRKAKNPENKFSLSRKTITDPNHFSASLYECNSEVRARLSAVISEKLFGLRVRIPKTLDRYLFLGIGFLDSEKSGQIEMKISDSNEIGITTSRNSKTSVTVKQSMKIIAKYLRKSRLWVLPVFTQTPPVGAGFHSGASLPIDSQYVDELGRLRLAKSIKIADVSLLPKIFVGSHTFNSMALNHSLIVNKKL